MLTGELRGKIERISNPLEVIEQIAYLLFTKRLDHIHALGEGKANRLRQPMARVTFHEPEAA